MSERQIDQALALAQRASENGIAINAKNPDLALLLEHETYFFNRNNGEGVSQIKSGVLHDRILAYAQNACPGKKAMFHYFKESVEQDLPYCWSLLQSADGKVVLDGLMESIAAGSPDVFACRNKKSDQGRIHINCFAPLISCEGEEQEPVFKKKLHLMQTKERISRNSCSGLTHFETVGRRSF